MIETVLSLFTFGVPLIASVSMFFFNKDNQSFHDYMVGTYVVSSENKRIFMTEKEYLKNTMEQYGYLPYPHIRALEELSDAEVLYCLGFKSSNNLSVFKRFFILRYAFITLPLSTFSPVLS